MITAKEAAVLAAKVKNAKALEESVFQLEAIDKAIEKAAMTGATSLNWNNTNSITDNRLKDLGYTLEWYEGGIGGNQQVIKW